MSNSIKVFAYWYLSSWHFLFDLLNPMLPLPKWQIHAQMSKKLSQMLNESELHVLLAQYINKY